MAALTIAHDLLSESAGGVTLGVPSGRIGERADVTAMDAYLRRRVTDRLA
ncbi:hypothetical protein ACWDTI_15690 [Gordonia sp. NPDC003424]